ncbi:MAG: tRNA lysidine(34) synthetase TilS [Acutalibacteraceae bacterium]
MISKIFGTINKFDMISDQREVVVGFSGGADSTALLHFLYYYASDQGKNFKVSAVHVNHNLRGSEAVRDENFTINFCKNHNIELIVKQADIKKISSEKKIGLEEAGRLARYEIFENIAQSKKAKIATAHTLSDRCETMIMNLIRGSSLKGLCSIPPIRGNIIRPLIELTREEIELYCKNENLEFINDSSNFEKDYTRNKIRLDIIPYIKSINPSFEKSVGRSLDILASEEDYMENIASKELSLIKSPNGYAVEKIKNLDFAIKRRVISKILKQNMCESFEQKHINLIVKMIDSNLKGMSLPNNIEVYQKNGYMNFFSKNLSLNNDWEYKIKNFNILTEIKTNIIIKVLPFCKYEKSSTDKGYIVDWDKIPSDSVIRNRRPRDRFFLPKRKVTKSLKKLFNELKLPESIRKNISMVASENEVIWIDGIGVSGKYLPDRDTKNIAIIHKE